MNIWSYFEFMIFLYGLKVLGIGVYFIFWCLKIIFLYNICDWYLVELVGMVNVIKFFFCVGLFIVFLLIFDELIMFLNLFFLFIFRLGVYLKMDLFLNRMFWCVKLLKIEFCLVFLFVIFFCGWNILKRFEGVVVVGIVGRVLVVVLEYFFFIWCWKFFYLVGYCFFGFLNV